MQRSVQAAPERARLRRSKPAPNRTRLRRLTPPASLAALLGLVAIIGTAWALLVPPWQTPDEPAHFAYAQSLAENLRLPGDKHRSSESSDQIAGDDASRGTAGAFFPLSAPPSWDRSAYDAYLKQHDSAHPPSQSNGGGPNPSSQNPPLYYLYGDAGYVLDVGGNSLGRLASMRIWGVTLLLATTLGGWLLAGEALGRRRLPQLAAAATVGLLPMVGFMTTAVNADALLIAEWTWALWLGSRVINHRARAPDVAALCAVGAAAVLTKSTSYALLIPLALALLIGWRRRPSGERRRALGRLVPLLLILILPIVGWLALSAALHRTAINQIGPAKRPFTAGDFIDYVWQFYLPRLPFMGKFRLTGPLPFYVIWIGEGTGSFGWLNVSLPGWLYTAATVVWAGICVTTLGLLTRIRTVRSRALVAFYAIALVALLGLLHVTEFRAILGGGGVFLQGRYLLPVVSLLGLAVGLIVARLPRPARAPAAGLVIIGLVVLQLISFTSILHTYYV